MNLGEAIHKALDYFFCDRCITEVTEGRLSFLLGEICPVHMLFKLLPEEDWVPNHPILWPRSWLGKVLQDKGKQKVGEAEYDE